MGKFIPEILGFYPGFRELIIDNGYTIKRWQINVASRSDIYPTKPEAAPVKEEQFGCAVAPDDDKIDRRNLLPITIRKRRETNGVYYVAVGTGGAGATLAETRAFGTFTNNYTYPSNSAPVYNQLNGFGLV
ncbi:hypothetical protein MKW98_000626 [Papaver atlanticum]|uniref:Uncharacterized protein n=1 Tax=Papaver atlanticum TaxID=357466 RepID=A0AAD4S4Q6_9MAGN|nr:hypothetical protein MKW98_000626 [Papaver atlanticum]